MLDLCYFLTTNLPLAVNILGQSVETSDLLVIGLLILLEGLLSIDNALVLGMLVKRLPKHQRAKALSYGLVGAFVFRVVAILLSAYLLQWTIVKLIGGGYLIYIAVKHLFWEDEETEELVQLDAEGQPELVDAVTGKELDEERLKVEIEQRVPIAASLITEETVVEPSKKTKPEDAVCDVPSHNSWKFWKTVAVIELTDIAFAVDSILAAMALAGSSNDKLWVVVTGGILGVILMRFAASVFVRLLEKYPRFETSAYLLVVVIGLKLLFDWAFNSNWSFSNWTSLGAWQEWFANVETARRGWVENYHHWLDTSWILGRAKEAHVEGIEHVPHLLDFHDLRRPECMGFWLIMLLCFLYGFMPRKHADTSEKEAKGTAAGGA
jgi:YkoY family integral membrane protein